MQVTKIVVGKGRSEDRTQGKEGKWLKVFYEIEATLDEGEDPVAAKLGIEHMLDQWLQGEIVGPEDPPKLDLANLEALPWTTYRTKELAEPGHTGWIKNPRNFPDFDDPVAADLAKTLTRSDGKLELGEYVYSLSGKEKQFINRKPIKKIEKFGKDASKSSKKQSEEKETPLNQNSHEKDPSDDAEKPGLKKW